MYKNLQSTKRSILFIRHITTVTNIDVTSSPTKPFSEVPGPTALPGIGQLYHYLPGGSLYNLRGYDLQNLLYKRYGPVVKMKGMFGARDSILLFDPEASLQIYRSENSKSVRIGFFAGDHYKHVIKKEKGKEKKYNGLIFDQGDTWKDIRTTVSPFMMQTKSLKIYAEPMNEIAEEVVARMKSLRNENKMIENNLLEEFMSYILEFTGQIAFGRRFHAFDPNSEEHDVAQQILKNIKQFFTLSGKLDFQPHIWRYIPNKTYRTAMQFFEDVEKLNEKLVRASMEKLKTDPKPEDKKGVIEKIAEINEEIALAFTDDLFFVGVDTLANGMLSVLYLLATNPDKQSKLREELLSKESRRPYLKACIREAARIRPVAFGNLRMTTKEYNLFGYEIPKDTMIVFCHEHMCLRDNQYPKANQFIPERWLVDNDHPLYHGNAHPAVAAHFGYGARGCVGRKVADMEMETLISSIIEKFSLEWRGGPMKVYQSVINQNMAPYNFVYNDI